MRTLGWAAAIALFATATGIGASEAQATLIFKLETVVEEAFSPDTEASALESESNTEDGFEFTCFLNKQDGNGSGDEFSSLSSTLAGGKSFAASFVQSILSAPKSTGGNKGRGNSQSGGNGGGGGGLASNGGGRSNFGGGLPGIGNWPSGNGGGNSNGQYNPPSSPNNHPGNGGPSGNGGQHANNGGGNPPPLAAAPPPPTGSGPGSIEEDCPPPPLITSDPPSSAPAAVPEPSTFLMGGLALMGLGFARFRRTKKS